MNTTKISIRVVTANGSNASAVGEAHTAGINGTAWRNSVDRCDSDGHGRVFIDCDDQETADHVGTQLDDDDRVISYDV